MDTHIHTQWTQDLGDAHLEREGQRGRLRVQEAVQRPVQELGHNEPLGAGGGDAVEGGDVLFGEGKMR